MHPPDPGGLAGKGQINDMASWRPGDIGPTVVRGGEWIVTYPPHQRPLFDVTYLPGHVQGQVGGAAVGKEVMGKIDAALAVDPWLAENPARWDFICDTVPARSARR